jgi:hypothetical protein
MINYADAAWRSPEDKQRRWQNKIKGMAIAYVIGEDVVFTDSVDATFGSILCFADSFTENWADEVNNLYSVNVLKNGAVIEQVVCDELIYSLLLSDAKVYDIDDGHQHANMVMEGWKFLDGTFKVPGVYE